MEKLKFAVRRNILSRLLDDKQPLRVNGRHLYDLKAEAEAAEACVQAACKAASQLYMGDEAPPAPHEVVRRVANDILDRYPVWGDGRLAATAAKEAVAAVEAASEADTASDESYLVSQAIEAAAWAAAAATGEPLEGDFYYVLAPAILKAAVKAVGGEEDDRILAGAVVLAAASAMHAAEY
jgi:hypothetical protein